MRIIEHIAYKMYRRSKFNMKYAKILKWSEIPKKQQEVYVNMALSAISSYEFYLRNVSSLQVESDNENIIEPWYNG